MKANFYAIGAGTIIAGISAAIYCGANDIEPAASAAILLGSIAGLGWGAGARSSQAEIDRLNIAESARRVRAACDADVIKRLTAEIERLKDCNVVFA